MLNTTMNLTNDKEIEEILLNIVKGAYDQIKNDAILLYIDKDE